MNVLSRRKIDANGEALLNFYIGRSYFAFINFGESNQVIYLKPDGTYEVSVDFSKKYLDVNFAGKDANINTYLEQAKQRFREFKYRNKEYYQWNKEEYPLAIQKIDSILTLERKAFFQANTITKEDKELLEDLAKAEILSSKMSHFLANYNPVSLENQNIPPVLQNLNKSVPFNENLLQAQPESYLMVIKFYSQILSRVAMQESLMDVKNMTVDSYLEISYPIIKKLSASAKFKEFMLADIIMNCLMIKIPENFNSIFNEFKESYPNSGYIPKIYLRYNSLTKISKGNKAFEIEGKNISDKTVKLSDFNGKIVYIDLWATWCGPCIKEFPNSVALQKKFKANKEIIFLFVSLDKDRNKWKNYLLKHPELTGIHINLLAPELEKTMQNYNVNSVPRYILIDKIGGIISSSADAPSSDKIESTLRNLLK
ncbi:hypothetical protein GCM10027442_04700 [Emticicia fontis]